MWYYISSLLIAFVLSCVLLVTLKTILEKKKIESIKDERFNNCFLVIMTIFITICIICFKLI